MCAPPPIAPHHPPNRRSRSLPIQNKQLGITLLNSSGGGGLRIVHLLLRTPFRIERSKLVRCRYACHAKRNFLVDRSNRAHAFNMKPPASFRRYLYQLHTQLFLIIFGHQQHRVQCAVCMQRKVFN